MKAMRTIALMMLATAAACSARQAQTTVASPEDAGPKVSLYVDYSGGLLNRVVNVSFRAEERAYLIVGHLGGDGVLSILHPLVPGSRGFMPRGSDYQSVRFYANHDGIPSLFSHTLTPFRSFATMQQSYDGRGHGYVFAIASRSPLATHLIADQGGFTDLYVDDYYRLMDPRRPIQELARALSGGKPFTLRFATSWTTNAFTSYADRMFDCSVLGGLSFGFANLSYWNFGPGLYSRRGSGCESHGYWEPVRSFSWQPVHTDPRNDPIDSPTPVEKPTLDNPSQRPIGFNGPRFDLGRPRIDDVSAAQRSAFDRDTRGYGSRLGDSRFPTDDKFGRRSGSTFRDRDARRGESLLRPRYEPRSRPTDASSAETRRAEPGSTVRSDPTRSEPRSTARSEPTRAAPERSGGTAKTESPDRKPKPDPR